jgi:hypothetical protein
MISIKILLIIIIIIAIIYFGLKYYYDPGRIHVFKKGPFNLSDTTIILSGEEAKELLQSSSGATLSVFVKVDGYDKTGHYDATPIPIIEQPGSWSLNYLPISKESNVPAYTFDIVTMASTGEVKESINLPFFPEQKWTYITILKYGRRFDVLYNNKIVGSKYCDNYPKIDSQAIRVGNSKLSGTAGIANGAPKRYTYEEVGEEWASRSDTRGVPYLSDDLLPTLGCPSGFFCFTPLPDTKSNKKFWSSPYA